MLSNDDTVKNTLSMKHTGSIESTLHSNFQATVLPLCSLNVAPVGSPSTWTVTLSPSMSTGNRVNWNVSPNVILKTASSTVKFGTLFPKRNYLNSHNKYDKGNDDQINNYKDNSENGYKGNDNDNSGNNDNN